MALKRARDKLDSSIPAQLQAGFRLLINRDFPEGPSSDTSLSSPPGHSERVSLQRFSMCARDSARAQSDRKHSCTKHGTTCSVCLSVFACLKSLRSLDDCEQYLFVFQQLYKWRVCSLAVIYSRTLVAVFPQPDLLCFFFFFNSSLFACISSSPTCYL